LYAHQALTAHCRARVSAMISILFATFASASAWDVAHRCPMAMNTGDVGSCKIWPCSEDRGPAHCTLGSCYCNEGYCRYPSSTLHIQSRYCVSRIPDATCHATRFCYSGGLTRSFCESGLCMCKWGYKAALEADGVTYNCVANGDDPSKFPDPGACSTDTGGTCGYFGCGSSRNAQCSNGKCVCAPGQCAVDGACQAQGSLSLAAGSNSTNGAMTFAEMEEVRKYDNWMVTMNVVAFTMWIGAAAAVLLFGAFLLRRKLRSSAVDASSAAWQLLEEDGCHE